MLAFLKGARKGRMCMCAFIEVSGYMCMYEHMRLYCVKENISAKAHELLKKAKAHAT